MHLFRSGHDLEMWSNFQSTFLSLNYNSFDASQQEKHNAGTINVVPLLSQKLLQKKFIAKTSVSGVFAL